MVGSEKEAKMLWCWRRFKFNEDVSSGTGLQGDNRCSLELEFEDSKKLKGDTE